MRWTALLPLFALFSIDAGAAIRGSILTTEGNPIPAASVRIYALEDDGQRRSRLRSDEYAPKPLAQGVSDSKGNFSIEAPAGSHVVRLQIDKDGYAPAAAFAAPDFDLAGVVLEPASATRGTIRDRGRPAAGFTVRFSDNDGAEWVARTDEEGRYSVPDPSKWARVVTVVSNEGMVWTEVSLRSDLSPDRALRRGEAISGTLVASDGRTPVGGARIVLDGSTIGETAEDGSFRIVEPPHGWERIEFVAENGWVTRTSNPRSNLGTVRLGTSSSVVGNVRAGQAGIPGVRVALVADAGGPAFFGVPEHEAVSDARGNFAIDAVAPGRYRVQARHPSYMISEGAVVEVLAGGRAEQSIAAVQGTVVTGHVVNEEGQAIAAAGVLPKVAGQGQIRMAMLPRSYRSWSASDGRFVTRLLSAGEPTVLEARTKGYPAGVSDPVRASATEPVTGVRITIPQGFTVAGRITDEFQNPVEGARVAAQELRGEGNRFIVIGGARNDDDAVFTDAEGRYVIRLAEGQWNITAGGGSWSYTSRNAVDVRGDTDDIDFVLRPAVALRGRVVRKGSGGIANARVSVMAQGGGPQSAMTGPDGSFEITGLSPGSSMVMVDKPDEMLREMRMTTIPQDDMLFEVPPGATLSGRVVDAESEAPLAAFSIAVEADRSGGGIVIRTLPVVRQFENENGEFVLEHVTSDPAELVVRAPGFVEKRVRGIEAPAGEMRDGLVIEMERGTTVAGRVTDESGAALSGVRIARREQTPTGMPPPMGGGSSTDAEGRYETGPFDGETVTLLFERDGYRTEVRDVKLDRERVTADVRMGRGATISGQVVTESGAPVAGASVSASSGMGFGRDSVTSDSSGMFTLEGIGEGSVRVTAEKSGYVPAGEDVNPAENRTLRLVLGEGGVVTGRVRGLSHTELADTRVDVRSGGSQRSAPVDQSGAFRVDGVRAGTASVTATSRRFGPGRTSPVSTVEVSQGAEAWVEIDMSGGHQVSGEVTINGERASDVMVSFAPADPVIQTRSSATSDAMGRYSVSGLQAGRYRVVAVRFGTGTSWQGEHTVERDDSFDIDIREVTIEGRVIDASTGRGVEGAALEASPSEDGGLRIVGPGRGPESGVDGVFTLRGITPGRWTIRATAQGLGSAVETIDVGTSGARVELRLSPSEGVVLRVVDAATGAPLGAFVTVRNVSGVIVFDESVRPGGDGTSRLPLAAGSYRIRVFAPGYAGQTVAAASPSTGVTVPLTRGGTISVDVSGSDTLRARIVDVQSGESAIGSRGGLTALTPGVNVLRNVAPGAVRIDVIDGAGAVERSVTVSVAEGGTASVSL